MIKWVERETVTIPDDVSVEAKGVDLHFRGPKGEVVRSFVNNYVRMDIQGKTIKILTSKDNRKTFGILGTWVSGIRQGIEGVTRGYQYEMKIDYTHFPMRVSVRGNQVVVENFLGERSPRTARILGSCQVSVKGDRIYVSGTDKRDVGETCANIERATKIKGFDLRVFQDGIYLLGEST